MVTKRFNDWIYITALCIVLRVVVTVANTEMAQNGTKLSQLNFLSLVVAIGGLWQTASELTTLTIFLFGIPFYHVVSISYFVVRLSMVFKHLREGVTSAQPLQVIESHLARQPLLGISFSNFGLLMSVNFLLDGILIHCLYDTLAFGLRLLNVWRNYT